VRPATWVLAACCLCAGELSARRTSARYLGASCVLLVRWGALHQADVGLLLGYLLRAACALGQPFGRQMSACYLGACCVLLVRWGALCQADVGLLPGCSLRAACALGHPFGRRMCGGPFRTVAAITVQPHTLHLASCACWEGREGVAERCRSCSPGLRAGSKEARRTMLLFPSPILAGPTCPRPVGGAAHSSYIPPFLLQSLPFPFILPSYFLCSAITTAGALTLDALVPHVCRFAGDHNSRRSDFFYNSVACFVHTTLQVRGSCALLTAQAHHCRGSCALLGAEGHHHSAGGGGAPSTTAAASSPAAASSTTPPSSTHPDPIPYPIPTLALSLT